MTTRFFAAKRPERSVAAEASPPLRGRKAALAAVMKIVYDKREGKSLLPPPLL